MNRLKNLFSVNPIIVKEIRSRMRGPRAFVTLTVILLLLGGMLYATLQIILATARYTNVLSPQVGRNLFAVLAFLELFIISAVTPAVTAGAISGEKEKQTYEMLVATPLSSASILWGKLVSALSYVFLLLFAAVPLASLVFIFGGVTLREMLRVLMVLIVVAVTFGVLGLFMSALFGRTGRATIGSYIIVMLLLLGPLFVSVLVAALRQGEPPRWLLAPSPISALSAALATNPSGGMVGSEIFYILGGIFNMGISPLSQTSIPRPLYHYSLPIYAVLSVVLYLFAMRLIQPARRWRVMRVELLSGLGVLFLLIGGITAGFVLTANRYENAGNRQGLVPTEAPVRPLPVGAVAVEEPVVVVPEGTPTPTPATPPGELADMPLEEQAEIYAAVARQLYTVDHTFGNNAPNWPVLYLISTTDDMTGDPNAEQSDPVVLPEEILSGVAERLNELPAKVLWVQSAKDVPIDDQTGAVENGNGAMITFGNIHPQDDGTVHVSASLYIANLAASGKTYILSIVDGVWQVTGSTGVEWIS